MKQPQNEERETRRTDAWRERLRALLAERGNKADLAKFLCDGDLSKLAARKVHIAKILNQGTSPNSELLLAVEEWIQRKAKNP